MLILSHRGLWKSDSEKNSLLSFQRSFELGFGVETDVRDYLGDLVISHDIGNTDCILLSDFFDLYASYSTNLLLALNIKADGLQSKFVSLVNKFDISNYFVFDMAVPDMRGYLQSKTPAFTRLSEYEPHPAFLGACKGVWLDAFESEWYSADTISFLLNQKKEIAIVSPELHGRSHLPLWGLIKAHDFHRNDLVSMCTDFPMEAKEYFYGQD